MDLIFHLSRKAVFSSLALVFLVNFASVARAQSANAAPAERQLLNGLKVLISQRPNQTRFLMKLRIKSGAAFDLAGKDGTMALLTDALTPEANTRQDIADELGGRFTIAMDYDTIDFTIEGRAADFNATLKFCARRCSARRQRRNGGAAANSQKPGFAPNRIFARDHRRPSHRRAALRRAPLRATGSWHRRVARAR
ncbi:MAG: hypothetical protein WKF30_01490 [Pyrinomonadaceae bacterium]